MSDIDQSILDAMTEEERAALLDDDDSDDAIVVMPGDEGADDDDEDGEGAADDGDDKADKKAEPGADNNQSADDNLAAEAAEENEQAKPLFRAEVPADIADKYAAIDTKEEELIAKFEDGDMTTREYNAELRKLNKERNDLEWLERKAELSQETAQQQLEDTWLTTVKAFLPDHPAISENEENWNSFDQVLRTVTAVRINAGQAYGKAELERAYKIWADERGIEVKAPAAKASAAKAPAAKDEQKKELPPTLAKVPAASNEDTDDGKYAALERLADKDPQAYQEAIAKMSAAEYEAYTKFQG